MARSVPGTRARLLSWAAVAMIVAGACSSAATPAPAASGAAAAGPRTFTLATATGTGSIGKYLTGDAGRTLYTFKNDPPNTTTSACTGTCATNWPAFVLGAGDTTAAGAGVTGAITTITRPDGGKQVAYNGAPLYYFAGDSAAGDTNGQGVKNIWFVAAP